LKRKYTSFGTEKTTKLKLRYRLNLRCPANTSRAAMITSDNAVDMKQDKDRDPLLRGTPMTSPGIHRAIKITIITGRRNTKAITKRCNIIHCSLAIKALFPSIAREIITSDGTILIAEIA
jgi:hypothetical protein